MRKLIKSQSGMAAFEVMLLILVLGVLAFVGYRAYSARYTAPKPDDVKIEKKNVEKTADPYAGWKTALLANEKITFKYPSSWLIKNDSRMASAEYPADSDRAVLTAPSGFVVDLWTGVENIGGVCESCEVFLSEPINSLGKNLKLNYSGSSNTSVGLILSQSSDCSYFCSIESKNLKFAKGFITTDKSPSMMFTAGTKESKATLSDLKKNEDAITARKIFESMTY